MLLVMPFAFQGRGDSSEQIMLPLKVSYYNIPSRLYFPKG